ATRGTEKAECTRWSRSRTPGALTPAPSLGSPIFWRPVKRARAADAARAGNWPTRPIGDWSSIARLIEPQARDRLARGGGEIVRPPSFVALDRVGFSSERRDRGRLLRFACGR